MHASSWRNSKKKVAKHVLNSSGDEFRFALAGISSADDQYRVVSLINDALNISLFLSDYIPMNLKRGNTFEFSLYRYTDQSLGLEYFLIPNISNFEKPGTGQGADLFAGQDIDERVRLIKELPKTDYFLLLKGELYEHYKFDIFAALRSAGSFTQVQAIEPDSLPSRKNLIF